MSASLASARMNSRHEGLAWIAASFRSSDLTTSAPLTRDGDPGLAARAVAAPRAHRHPDARAVPRRLRGGRLRDDGALARGGVRLEDLVDRAAEDLTRVLQGRDFLRPELDLELSLDARPAQDRGHR